MTPDKPQPLLAAAFTCERILRETDGVLSAIRIVDSFAIPESLPQNIVPQLRWWTLIYFKSGEARGRYMVSLVIRPPERAATPLGEPVAMDLEGGSHGVTLAIELRMAVGEPGLYWIDVLVDGTTVTSMPISVRRAASPQTSPSQGTSQEAQ